jgi:hypothetical protein
MLVVPGSARVRLQAEAEGLHEVFTAAGARVAAAGLLDVSGDEPRQAAPPGAQSASTSNRNFEGRQGKGGRTHLVSPQVAAATAITRLSAPADLARRPMALLPLPTGWTEPHGQVHDAHRRRRTAAAQQRRHRPDHPGELPQAGDPTGSRTDSSPPGAPTRSSSSTPRLRRGVGPRRRSRLRHRVLARARGLGAHDYGFRVVHQPRGSRTSSAATPARPGC